MNLFGMLQLSGSALSAERQRAEVVTANMANAETTKTAEGGPYQRKLVVFRSREQGRFPHMTNAGLLPGDQPGVEVEQVVADQTPPEMRYEPGNPEADKNGF